VNNFYATSRCLKVQDKDTKDQVELLDLDKWFQQAIINQLKVQRMGLPFDLAKIADLSTEKKVRQKLLQSLKVETIPKIAPPPLGLGK